MAVITLTITLTVPDNTEVAVDASGAEEPRAAGEGIPTDVLAAVHRLVPTRYREWVELYLRRCVDELQCTLEMPAGQRRFEYLNVFPPDRCRRARVAGLSYASSRTALYTGPIDITSFERAVQTFNSGEYVYPKLPHLDGIEAVDEAVTLTKAAIERRER